MRRTLAALGAALALLVPLLLSLQTTIIGTRVTRLARPAPEDRVMPIEAPIQRDRPDRDRFETRQLRLRTTAAAALAAHRQIRLSLATYAETPRLEDGDLAFAGTSCSFRTVPSARIRDNDALAFARGEGCAPMSGTPTGDVIFTVRLNRAGKVALWTFVSDNADTNARAAAALVVADDGLARAGLVPIVRGDVLDEFPEARATRLSLLASMWELSGSPAWIVAALCACAALVGAAVLLAGRTDTSHAGLRGGGAACLAALGLGVAYAVCVPPFQAADEPNHFLAVGAYNGRAGFEMETEAWARRMAFEEIRFDPHRPYSPLDRGESGQRWRGVGVPDDIRGAGMRAEWWLTAPLARRMRVQSLFLVMRLTHATLFAAAAGLFVFLAWRFTGAPAPELLAIPLFLVPTLPYFGMHMSNYAPLLAMYVLLACAVVIATWDGAGSHAAGPIAGAALAGAIAFSRSSLPILAFVVFLLAGRIGLGDARGRRWPAFAFWLGFTLMLAGGLTVVDGSYLGALQSGGAGVSTSLVPLAWGLNHPWLLIVPAALALAAELAGARLRRTAGGPATGGQTARWIALALALVILVASVGSLWIPFPGLNAFDPNHRPPALDYVRNVVVACATFLRFGRPDNLTSLTFFGGFGWLETLAPDPLVSALAGASALALVLLLVWIARAGSARALAWVGFVLAGFVASSAAYGLSIIRAMPADLHGRYLLGLYLCLLVVCWSGVARVAAARGGTGRTAAVAIAGACCLAVNVYCLAFILGRYF